MSATGSKDLVFTILRHAEDFPWRMQPDIGLLGLRLDDRREFRLHVWAPAYGAEESPIHDHPYSFTSEVIVGELTNTRYEEDPGGEAYTRLRYPPPAEHLRRSDSVRLSPSAATFTEGDRYGQLASELHSSWQVPGTVTVIRCSWEDVAELTVCVRHEGAWRSGQARDATRHEIKSMAAAALEWF